MGIVKRDKYLAELVSLRGNGMIKVIKETIYVGSGFCLQSW